MFMGNYFQLRRPTIDANLTECGEGGEESGGEAYGNLFGLICHQNKTTI